MPYAVNRAYTLANGYGLKLCAAWREFCPNLSRYMMSVNASLGMR